MQTYAEYEQPAATRATLAVIGPAPVTVHAGTRAHRAQHAERRDSTYAIPTATAERGMGWRDLAQSFAQDAAEMPIVSRLLAGQVVLALAYAGLRGALALWERPGARRMSRRLLGGLTVGVGIACAWAAVALVSRTRVAPAVTAYFTYGSALRHYLPPRQRLARAA